MLSLSRHDAGVTECRQESVRVDALLLDVIERLRPLAEARGVALELNAIEACEMVGDDIRLSQAFFNVVDNAIKYTAKDGSVDVQCRVKDWSAVIVISDTGIGIPPEHLGRVFDRFYRVDSSRHSLTGGAGLGLAISRTAVLAHQGEITIQSELGVGRTVTIRLTGVSRTETLVPHAHADRIAASGCC
ncbi:MAG: sensor histidine kinase [Planctomycetaceae bacterium]